MAITIEEISLAEYNVHTVNRIKDEYPSLRHDSKAPTFALTYQGTWSTLVNNCGFSKSKAMDIETNYHILYEVSDQAIQNKLTQAAKDGYVTVAFGLKLRTPLMKKCLMNSRNSLREAAAEGRTAGNALGQSYGLLNNRAVNAFMEKVWASPYKYDIEPVALIHDAIYLLIKDDINVVKFVNDYLIKEMQWQELPELVHDEVKLGANLDIFYPDWSKPITLPNSASIKQIRELCEKGAK